MARDLPVAERLVPLAGHGRVRGGVEVPGNDEGDGARGQAAGLLVPCSKPGDLVEKLLGLKFLLVFCAGASGRKMKQGKAGWVVLAVLLRQPSRSAGMTTQHIISQISSDQ